MAPWRHAMTELFATHRARLEAFARRRGAAPQDAPDLVQDAFLRLLATGSTGSATEDRRLLYAILRNAAFDQRKSATRRAAAAALLAPEQVPQGEADPEVAFGSRQALDRLLIALRQLPATTQEVMILRRIDGLPMAEIARRLGIPLSTAEKHLLRAIRHCAAALADPTSWP